MFTFLMRGSPRFAFQKDVRQIKKWERNPNITIIPVWTPRELSNCVVADIGSKDAFSTARGTWTGISC